MNYAKQYAVMLRGKNCHFAQIDKHLFVRHDHWIAPAGPMATSYHLDKLQCDKLLKDLGGLWVQWTNEFDARSNETEWYAVICKRHITLSEISSSKRRSEMRRGLSNCDVRKVDAAEIAKNGYETYCAALNNYGGSLQAVSTPAEYERRVMGDEPFSDIRHQWGVYHDGRMVAFAQNLIYDKTEVNYTNIKLHPDYLKYYPAYALIYKMNEYYLEQRGFEYVNDGSRSILHETGIQDFLIKKFGFEKAYMNLHIYFRPPLGLVLKMAKPFRKWLSKVDPKLAAVLELDRIAVNQ